MAAILRSVTVKNLSGRFSQKIGTATVSAQATTLRSATISELNARQAQAVGPVESRDEGLTVMKAERCPTSHGAGEYG